MVRKKSLKLGYLSRGVKLLVKLFVSSKCNSTLMELRKREREREREREVKVRQRANRERKMY